MKRAMAMGLWCVTTWLASRVGVGGAEPAAWRLALPRDYQVQQRETRTEGTVVLEGVRPTDEQAGDVWEIRWDGVAGREAWQPLTGLEAGTGRDGFRVMQRLPAGGWYGLGLRIRRGTEVLHETRVEHVGVGEVFVVAGQSNSANHGEKRQESRSGMVAARGADGWQPAHDPQPGASGNAGSFMPAFGDGMFARFQVPIGIIAAGVGATSVREWQPRGVRFPNPPTLTSQVVAAGTEWESRGALFDNLTRRLRSAGERGFRAVLWHQGESDANQADPTRTLSGDRYVEQLTRLIRESRRVAGWEVPWFVAQVSYHVPTDPGSPDIRSAQQRVVWEVDGVHAGPDSDALGAAWRDGGGRGVHFSADGLRKLAEGWVERVGDWVWDELAGASGGAEATGAARGGVPPRLHLPGAEEFEVAGRRAFVFLPPSYRRTSPQPWIFYAPTLPGYPDEAERWMHERFLAAGIAVAGVDVGEAYGSPASHGAFAALYGELAGNRGFATRACLFGRSRGGLWASSWAIASPERVSGLIGIYPVYDFRTYPGIAKAAEAYGVDAAGLEARAAEWNPVSRLDVLARAGIPVALIHGDDDRVVPLKENSLELVRRYREEGRASLVKLITLEGQGHNFFEGFFRSRELVDHAIARARAGSSPVR